jgi:hypothetical protein
MLDELVSGRESGSAPDKTPKELRLYISVGQKSPDVRSIVPHSVGLHEQGWQWIDTALIPMAGRDVVGNRPDLVANRIKEQLKKFYW